jgi:predicted DNA-binding transcriptional regulator AlpA
MSKKTNAIIRSHRENPVDEHEAARYVGFTASALRVWRWQGRGPAFIRHGRSVRYLPSDLDAWLTRHRVETSESRGPRDHSRKRRAPRGANHAGLTAPAERTLTNAHSTITRP